MRADSRYMNVIRKMTFEIVVLMFAFFVTFSASWWIFAHVLDWPTAGIAFIFVPSILIGGVGAVRGLKLRWKLHYQQGKSLDPRFVVPRVLVLTLFSLSLGALMIFAGYSVLSGRVMLGFGVISLTVVLVFVLRRLMFRFESEVFQHIVRD